MDLVDSRPIPPVELEVLDYSRDNNLGKISEGIFIADDTLPI